MAGKGEGHAIGIDLGTTYSCVGVWQHDRVEIGDDQGNRTTPSYVASTDTERLIGDAAKNQVAVNPIDTVVASLVAMPTLSGFLSIKLDQTNYPLWRAQIVPLLKSKKLLGYVDGSLPCPQAFLMDSEGKPTNVENPDHLFWHQQDQLILSWINKSLTPQVLSTVTRFQSSHESWAFLERRYAAQSHHHIQQLLGELHNTMRDELPIADYVDKLNGIADKLALIGHLVEDSLLVTVLMNNVGQTFEVTIASAQARDTPIGLDDLIALLLSAEQRQKGLPRLRSTPEPTTLSSPKKSSVQSRRKSRFKSAKVSSRRRGSSTGGSSDASTPKSSNSSSNGWWQSSGRPRGFGIDNLMALLLSTEQRQKGSIPGATAIENKSSSQPEGKSGFNSANGSSRGHGSSTRGFSNASNRGFPKSLNSSSIGRQSSGQSRGKSGLNSANGSSRRCGSSTRGSSNASNRGCPKSSNSSSSSRPRCQICGRLGHTAIDCYYRMNMAYEGRVPTQKLSALAASSGFNNGGTNGGNTWYTDSGASNHVNSDLAK